MQSYSNTNGLFPSTYTPYYQFDPQSIAQKGYVGFSGYQNNPYTNNAVNTNIVPVDNSLNGVNYPTNSVSINGSPYTAVGNKGAMINTQNSNWGINADGQKTFLGGTGYQWAGVGLNTAFGLFNAYQSYQSQKLAKEQFEDQKRLNHANYRMQANAFNNNLRNQQSGRGYIGMSGTAKRTLGAEYQTRKAESDY